MPTDEELVRQIQRGDILAFEVLVERYEGRLLNFVFRLTHNEPLSEEIVQNAFVAIYKKIDNIDTSRKFSSYFYQVAKNLTISEIRKLKPQLRLEEVGEISQDEDGAFEKMSARFQSKEIARAISHLENKYREVIKLYFFEELSYKEIAWKLELPINTVRTRLRRAKSMLKRKLAK